MKKQTVLLIALGIIIFTQCNKLANWEFLPFDKMGNHEVGEASEETLELIYPSSEGIEIAMKNVRNGLEQAGYLPANSIAQTPEDYAGARKFSFEQMIRQGNAADEGGFGKMTPDLNNYFKDTRLIRISVVEKSGKIYVGLIQSTMKPLNFDPEKFARATRKEMIVGKWVCTSREYIGDIQEEEKTILQALNSSLENNYTIRLKEGDVFESFTLLLDAENKLTGTWKLNDDTRSYSTIAEEKTFTYSIIKLSEEELVVQTNDNGLEAVTRFKKSH